MKVAHWQLLTELRAEIAKLLDRTLVLSGGGGTGDRTVARQHTRYLREEVARTAFAIAEGRAGGGEATALSSGFVERLRLGAGERSSASVPAGSLHAGAGNAGRGAAGVAISPELLARLRGELLARIEQLEERLSKDFSEGDVGQMIFPLVLLCDEMVMVRLAKEQHTLWHLLQTELFRINYGGDVFYEFADEQLSKPNIAIEVFETLYYCLQSGFVGRFGFDAGKVQRYRNLLSERILSLMPAEPSTTPPVSQPTEKSVEKRARSASRRSRAGESRSRRSSSVLYYGMAIAMIAVFIFIIILSTNT